MTLKITRSHVGAKRHVVSVLSRKIVETVDLGSIRNQQAHLGRSRVEAGGLRWTSQTPQQSEEQQREPINGDLDSLIIH